MYYRAAHHDDLLSVTLPFGPERSWMNRLEDMHCQGRSEGKGSRAGKGEDGVRMGGMRVKGKGTDEGG